MVSYILLSAFSNLPPSLDLFLAITSRILGLGIYRWWIHDSEPEWEGFLFFEWVNPFVFMAEGICSIPDQGKLRFET